MAKPKKALKSSKSKSVVKSASSAKAKSVVKTSKRSVVAHKSPKAAKSSKVVHKVKSAPVKAKPAKVNKVAAKPMAKTKVAKSKAENAAAKPLKKPAGVIKSDEANLKKLPVNVGKAAKAAKGAGKEKPLSEKDERLLKLKAIAEQMAKAKAAGVAAPGVPVDAAAVAASKDARKKATRGLTAKEKALVKEFERREMSPADAEARRNRLKNLIMLGKERNYLTYAEINDHLPDEMLEAEQIETIIGMINDMGILVYDEAPDAETLLMSDATPPVADEEAAAEAEAALSTVDSEFGRTTDPVRMYMREMGSVELLTREGEIEIAKRIEDGLKHMVQAISACPTTIADILALADRIDKDDIRADEVVDGLIDPNAPEEEAIRAIASGAPSSDDDEDSDSDITSEEEEEVDEEAAAAVVTADLLWSKIGSY